MSSETRLSTVHRFSGMEVEHPRRFPEGQRRRIVLHLKQNV